MPRCFCSRALLPVLLLLLAPARAAEQPWVEVRSPNFSVVTDGGEKRGREVALRFEQMRAAFGVLFQKINVSIPVPLQIVAFRDTRELRAVSPIWNGKPTQLAGFFQGGEDRNFIAIDLSSEAGWEIVFHEYAHLLINSNFPPMPVWFDEGFAEYCSSLKVTNQEIDFGLLPQGLPETLGVQRWMKTTDLLAVTHESADYNETDRRSIFYAQSWLMVHYFMTKKQLREVSRYLDLVQNQHLSIRDAFAEAFAMEPDQFDKALRAYFQAQATYFRAPAPPQVETSSSYTARALGDLEARAVLADLHYHLKDYREQGIKEFEALIKQQPDNLVANRSLGYAYLRQNRFDEAAACFRRAAAQDSKDARVHYYAVLLASRQAMMESRTPADLPGMQKELQTAITLDPGYADAYNLLAYTQSLQGDLKAAQASMAKAVELAPRNDLYAANLVQYYLRDQDLEKAAPLLNQLQNSSNEEIAAMARKNLQLLGQLRESQGARQSEVSPYPRDLTAPQWRPKPGAQPAVEEEKPEEPAKIYPVKHVYGTLLSVDCSPAPQASVTIQIAGKPRKYHVADTGKVILIGADQFSCSWHDRKVLINYKDSPQPELVILELQ